MDFCSWCVGREEASRLTGQGKSGGICKDHQKQFTMTPEKIKEAFKKARENGNLR